MKKSSLFLLLIAFCASNALAQFSTPNGNGAIHYNGGNVGIGTDQPQDAIHIFKRGLTNGEVHDLLRIQANSEGQRQTGFGARINFSFNKYGNVAGGTTSTLGAIAVYDANNESSYGTMAFATKERYDKLLENKMWLNRLGNLGIGTDQPQEALHLFRRGLANGQVHDMLRIQVNTEEKRQTGFGARINFSFNKYGNVAGGTTSTLGAISVYDANNESSYGTMAFATKERYDKPLENKMWLDRYGNLGIGTDTPDSKLTVAGKVHAQEVQVTVGAGATPDYVFADDYNLTSLEQTSSFIKENHHLPEVPSASELESKGMNVGEMNLLLLKKIEELTLHLIEKDTEIKEMRRDIDILKSKK